jgi:hypothetical protein
VLRAIPSFVWRPPPGRPGWLRASEGVDRSRTLFVIALTNQIDRPASAKWPRCLKLGFDRRRTPSYPSGYVHRHRGSRRRDPSCLRSRARVPRLSGSVMLGDFEDSFITGRTNSSTRSGRYRCAMIMAPLEASVRASEGHSGAPVRSFQWSLLAFSRGRSAIVVQQSGRG